MKYLVLGTGGVGGCMAGFLALADKDVSCIARGEHLETIKKNGLTLHSDLKKVIQSIPIKAYSGDEYMDYIRKNGESAKPDVIIVAVKGYSLQSIVPILETVSKSSTLVIPILNVFGTGKVIQEMLRGVVSVLDGCIYIQSYRQAPGYIRQIGKVFQLVYGARPEQRIPAAKQEQIAMDLRSAGIQVTVSDDVRRDTFIKWGFISAMACTGAYFDCAMEKLQRPGEERQMFCGLIRESYAIGCKLGIPMPGDYMVQNLSLIDHCKPETTTSMQKDLSNKHESEIEGMLFKMADYGRKLGVDIPTYSKVCEKFNAYR
ncbi:MAG: 2-dehydropantoate 2-reductase [Bacteroidales bacterium]|nr:2-dehydropantoate 2-reductase [Bacteroidales bacterium]